jgi:serine/threonine-protein kinase
LQILLIDVFYHLFTQRGEIMAKDAPKIKDLQNGVVKCENCSEKLEITLENGLEIQNCPKCGSVVFIPKAVKEYWLYKPLGGGGMGSVYKAVSEADGKCYAVKVLSRANRENDGLINILMNEGEIGGNIGEHKNIIDIVEYGHDDEEYFIASEFVEGERLDFLVKTEGRLSEARSLEIALQILEAEKHILNCGYLFRDLKPENVMIEKDGNVRLFDYGLCVSLENAATVNQTADLEGSPFYVPPERIMGAAEGEYSEIYSLGMIMFFMLTGRTYYSEAEIRDLIKKHVNSARIASVANHLTHCNPETIKVLDKMIARNPNNRYFDFNLLRTDLKSIYDDLKRQGKTQVIPGGASASESVSASGASGGFVKKLVSGLVVVAFIGLLVGGYFLWDNYKYNQLKQDISNSVATRLGISKDVKPADLSPEEVARFVSKKQEELIDIQKKSLPVFDKEKERSKIIKEFKITDARKPEHGLMELTRMFDEKVDREAKKKLEKMSKTFSESEEKSKIAEKLKITLPVKPPALSLKEVNAEFKKYITEQVKEKYSSRQLAKETMAMMKEYQEYKIGQTVEVNSVSGIKVKGRYKGRAGNKLMVGDHEILINDLSRLEALRFNPELCRQKIAKASKELKTEFYKKRKVYQKELIDKEKNSFYQKNGYYLQGDDWLDADATLKIKLKEAKKEFEKQQLALKNRVYDRVEKELNRPQFYRQHGFRQMDKKWYPWDKAVAVILAKKQAQFNKKQKPALDKIKREAFTQAENELYPAHGYIKHDGKWVEAYKLFHSEVETRLRIETH